MLARGTQALASGTSATAHLALSPVARRVLKVAALLRKPAFTPVMTINEHRGGHTRTGTVALTVPKVF